MFHVTQARVTTPASGHPPASLDLVVRKTAGPDVGLLFHATFDPVAQVARAQLAVTIEPGTAGVVEIARDDLPEFESKVRAAAMECLWASAASPGGRTAVFFPDDVR